MRFRFLAIDMQDNYNLPLRFFAWTSTIFPCSLLISNYALSHQKAPKNVHHPISCRPKWTPPPPSLADTADLLSKAQRRLFYARWVRYTAWFRSHKGRWGSVDLSDSHQRRWVSELREGRRQGGGGRREGAGLHLYGYTAVCGDAVWCPHVQRSQTEMNGRQVHFITVTLLSPSLPQPPH